MAGKFLVSIVFQSATLMLLFPAILAFSQERCGQKTAGDIPIFDEESHQFFYETVANEFPWLVTVVENGTRFCTATLISSSSLLTSGGCLSFSDTGLYKIILGTEFTKDGNDSLIINNSHLMDDNLSQEFSVVKMERKSMEVARSEAEPHSSLRGSRTKSQRTNGQSFGNDKRLNMSKIDLHEVKRLKGQHEEAKRKCEIDAEIVWAVLDRSIPLHQPFKGPICLPDSEMINKLSSTSEIASVRTSQQNRVTVIKRFETRLLAPCPYIVDDDVDISCSSKHPLDSERVNDSGSPLMSRNDNNYYLIGLQVSGQSCENNANYYLNIQNFLPWINNLESNKTCLSPKEQRIQLNLIDVAYGQNSLGSWLIIGLHIFIALMILSIFIIYTGCCTTPMTRRRRWNERTLPFCY